MLVVCCVTFSERLDVTNKVLKQTQQGLLRLTVEIRQQIQKIAELEMSQVLHADYDQKIARQEAHLQKQEQFLNILKEQQMRHETLVNAMLKEQEEIEHVTHWLAKLNQDAQIMIRNQKERMVYCLMCHYIYLLARV